MRARAFIGLAFATLLGVASCGEVAGTPVASMRSPNVDNSYGAPRVQNPIDPGRFLKAPCAVLTEAQSTGLGWEKEGTPHELDSDAPSCDWDSPSFANFDFGWLTSNGGGLADTYRAFRNDTGYFDPVTIAGYPGVFHFSDDLRKEGFCNLVVGIRDELTFRVGSLGAGPTACDTLKEMARLAITTMKAG